MNNFKLFVIFFLFLLTGCAANRSNIDHLQKEEPCPVQHTFNCSFNQIWQAMIRALAEEEIIKTMNPDAGIVVTEYGTVDNRELRAIDTVFGARTYKYSYSINMIKTANTKTVVSIKTNLKMSQIALYEREQSIPWLESYLRKKLFMRLCKQLKSGNAHGSTSFFPGNNNPQKASLASPPYKTVKKSDPPLNQLQKEQSESPHKLKPNALVLQVQNTLHTQGYDLGPTDGLMGRKTRKAIKQFQKDANIAITGRIDQNTLIALGLREGKMKTKDTEQKENTSSQSPSSTTEIQLANNAELMPTKDPFSAAIARIPQGSVLAVKSTEGEWYNVQYQDRTGYIHSSFVVEKGEVVPVQPSQKKPKKKQSNKTVSKNKNGDVHAEAKKQRKQQNKPPEGQKPAVQMTGIGKGKLIETTSLLSEPSFTAGIIQSVTAGQKLELLEKKGEFYKVRYNGTEGYIYADFVEQL